MKITDRPSSNRLQRRQPLIRFAAGSCAALAAVSLLIGSEISVKAQSDNFDSYSTTAQLKAAGWINAYLNAGLVTTTFPPVGSGKGLRMQADPYPGAAPAANMWYQTNDYISFYLAIDLVNWGGGNMDQAAVLFARLTDATTGTVILDQNPANAQGVICNYDASQHGENPSDRRGGQFQINMVSAGFSTITLAAAEITFEPGRSYRIVFSGSGSPGHFVAQAYDWNDLTTPLVTIQGDDSGLGYNHGGCGLLAFSRNGTTGTTDVTFDNYYAGATNPNLATPPALSHPIPGTPVLATRSPSARWKNFSSPASGITFTANTYSTNVINASATKLSLNGVDVSSHLVLSTNGTSISGSLPGSALDTNKLYSAELVVTDVAGTKSSTNTFWFDTFSDAYLLTSSVKTIEAEEYNYTAGTNQWDPIPVSGLDTNTVQINGGGIGYYDLVGTAGIDYSNHNANPDIRWSMFRTQDAENTINGGLVGVYGPDFNIAETDPGSDNIRSQHGAVGLLEYVTGRNETGDWQNYTRSFSPAFYVAYLRYSSFGATSNELYMVTSDPTQTGQTTNKLGTFRIPNNIRWINYLYSPLVDDAGKQPLLGLAGVKTLRLMSAGTPLLDQYKAMLNYVMLVQTPVSVYSSATVNGNYTLEASASPNYDNGTITVPAPSGTRFYRLSAAVPLTIKSISVSGGNVVLTLLH